MKSNDAFLIKSSRRRLIARGSRDFAIGVLIVRGGKGGGKGGDYRSCANYTKSLRAGAPSTINSELQPPTITSKHTSNNNNRRLDRPTSETGSRLALTNYPKFTLTLDKSSDPKMREQIVSSSPRDARVRKTSLKGGS